MMKKPQACSKNMKGLSGFHQMSLVVVLDRWPLGSRDVLEDPETSGWHARTSRRWPMRNRSRIGLPRNPGSGLQVDMAIVEGCPRLAGCYLRLVRIRRRTESLVPTDSCPNLAAWYRQTTRSSRTMRQTGLCDTLASYLHDDDNAMRTYGSGPVLPLQS